MADPAAAKKRSRFDSHIDVVVQKLVEVVDTPGFLQYCEKSGDVLQRAALIRSREVFVALRDCQYNLSFAKTQMQGISSGLADKTNKFSLPDPASRADWIETMERRVRAACRHVAQARLKNPRCSWLRQLFGDADGNQLRIPDSWLGKGPTDALASAPALSEAATEVSVAASSGEAREVADGSASCAGQPTTMQIEYLVGWAPELNMAWRLDPSKPKCPREYSQDSFPVGDGTDIPAEMPHLGGALYKGVPLDRQGGALVLQARMRGEIRADVEDEAQSAIAWR